ncbi:MAG: hypothetical protein H6739_26640 [Alphaproteobacteria bacterium]|nr:hypothetical protein [Alphaproteobacteria bacterium]
MSKLFRETGFMALGLMGVGVAFSGCAPPPGLNGPQLAEPTAGTGPCFEVNITDGIADAAELSLLFDCFNQHGAFEPLAPTVSYLGTSEVLSDFLEAANFGLEGFDLAAGLETASNLLSAPEQPLSEALSIYSEAYDRNLIRAILGLSGHSSAVLLGCEESPDPARCSLPRLGARVLDSDVFQRIEVVMDALPDSTESFRDSAEQLLGAMEQLSTGGNQRDNVIAEVAVFLFEGDEQEPSPLMTLQPWLAYLLTLDQDADGTPDLLPALTPYLADTWADGNLATVPERLLRLYTYNSDNQYVGFDGTSMLDELLVQANAMSSDAQMLFQPIEVNGTEYVPFDLVLSIFESFYEEGRGTNPASYHTDRENMKLRVDDAVNDVCRVVGWSDPLCIQLQPMVDIAGAIIDTGIVFTITPIAYGFLQTVDLDDMVNTVHGKHLDELTTDEILAASEFGQELSTATEPFTQVSLEQGLLEDSLELVPTFIYVDESDIGTFGSLTEAGEQLPHLLAWAVTPWAEGGPAVVPLLVPGDVTVAMLSDRDLVNHLDWIMVNLPAWAQDPNSAFYLDNLEALQLSFEENVVQQQELDLLAEAQEVLNNEALWMSGLRLGADQGLMDLLTPGPDRRGAPWYLYDLIERGVLDRIFSFAANVMDMIDDFQGNDDNEES